MYKSRWNNIQHVIMRYLQSHTKFVQLTVCLNTTSTLVDNGIVKGELYFSFNPPNLAPEVLRFIHFQNIDRILQPLDQDSSPLLPCLQSEHMGARSIENYRPI